MVIRCSITATMLAASLGMCPALASAQGPVWTPIGPEGGRVERLVAVPGTPSRLFAGTVDGIYRSSDGATTWERVSVGLPARAQVLDLVAAPFDAARLYVVVWGFPNASVYVTFDGGNTWVARSTGLVGWITALAVDPADPNRVFAGARGGQIFETIDGGQSWAAVGSIPESDSAAVKCLAVSPLNSAIVLAGSEFRGLYRSLDGGRTWSAAAGVDPQAWTYAVEFDPLGPDIAYLTVPVVQGFYGGGVYKTTNGGANWTRLSFPQSAQALALDPRDTHTVYVTSEWVPGVWKTTDGGLTWRQTSLGQSALGTPYGMTQDLAVDPADSGRVYRATYGDGVLLSRTGGDAWVPANRGLRATRLTSVVQPASGTLFAGDGGRVWRSPNRGLDWGLDPILGTSLLWATPIVDPSNTNIAYGIGRCAGEARLCKSTDGGTTWTALPLDQHVLAMTVARSSGRLYAGDVGIFRSDDGGLSWSPTGPIPTNVWVLAVDPVDANTVYAGLSEGLVRSTNGGGTWTPVSGLPVHGSGTAYKAEAIAIAPSSPSTVYLAYGPGVFKSIDAGLTWSAASTGLPSDPLTGFRGVSALHIPPDSPNTVLAGAAGGVYRTDDGGATWSLYGSGLEGVGVAALTGAIGGALYAATDTQGLYTTVPPGPRPAIASVGGPLSSRAIDQDVTVLGTAFESGVTVLVSLPGGGSSFLSGTQIQNVTATAFTMRITVADPGTYTLQVRNPSGALSAPYVFNVAGPTITATNPSSPLASTRDQDITVYGTGFAPGQTVTVTWPTGSSVLSGEQVRSVTSTSFVMRITMAGALTYSIRVVLPSGVQSNAHQVGAGAPRGAIQGRVFLDANANGAREPAEPFLADPAGGCMGERLAGVAITWSGSSTGRRTLSQCDGSGPFYRTADLAAGGYTLQLRLPTGWRQTVGPATAVTVAAGQVVEAGFGAAPPDGTGTGVATNVAVALRATPTTVTERDRVQFEATVTNTGPADAGGVRLDVGLTRAFGVITAAAGTSGVECRVDTVMVHCSTSTLRAGESFMVQMGATATAFGLHTVTAVVSSVARDDAQANNLDEVRVAVLAENPPAPANKVLYCGGLRCSRATIDRDLPTVVLTHGWSSTTDSLDSLWTRRHPNGGVAFINDNLQARGLRANVIQFVWSGAFTNSRGLPFRDEYVAARAHVEDAGRYLGEALRILLGDHYDRPINLVGHSFGSIVSLRALHELLLEAPDVPHAQLTVLDHPDHVNKILPALDYLGPSFQNRYGYRTTYFTDLLGAVAALRPSTTISIDNYYADEGSLSSSGAGVGDEIAAVAGVRVTNRFLENPNDVDDHFWEEAGVSNNHSGVQQWYRWTILADLSDVLGLVEFCSGSDWRNRPFAFDQSLNPCRGGWRESLGVYVGPALGAGSTTAAFLAEPVVAGATAVTTRLDVSGFHAVGSCDLQISPSGDAVRCFESPEAAALLQVEIPTGTGQVSFDYRFEGAEAEDAALVYADGVLVWMMSGAEIGSDWRASGPLLLGGLPGPRTFTVVYRGSGQLTGMFEIRGFAVTAGEPNRALLAEGTQNGFFDTRLALLNLNEEPVEARLRFQKNDGSEATHLVTIGSRTRATIAAADVPGLAGANFSTVVESDLPLVVDRTMTWDADGYGSHAEAAIERPSAVWYFAEGSTTGRFNLFYLLQNPHASPVDATVTFLRPSGFEPIVRPYRLPPRSRTTIWVNSLGAELASTDVSAVVESSQAIVAERAMYFDTAQPFAAGHASAGVTAPSTRWFLAEGATGSFFDLYVLVANPGADPAPIRATYLLPTGETVTRTYLVAARSRLTISVEQEDPRLADTPVSTIVESVDAVPIIVERAMWWPGPTGATWHEAHNSPGVTSAGVVWALAEGEEGGVRAAQTYILVANTSSFEGQASVTLLFEDGSTAERVVPLLPNSRTNVPIGSMFPEAAGRRFGALVTSLGEQPAAIVVERAIYTDAGGVTWAAGTNAVATRIR